MTIFSEKFTKAFINEGEIVINITNSSEVADALTKSIKLVFDKYLILVGVDHKDRPTYSFYRDAPRSIFGFKNEGSYYCKNEIRLIEGISRFIDDKNKIKEYKEERKTKKKADKEKLKANISEFVKVGDVFYESWGYDQTNVYYHQIILVKGQTATLRRISYDVVEGSESRNYHRIKPCKDSFCGDEYKKRITLCGDSVSIGSGYDSLSKYDRGESGISCDNGYGGH